MAPTNDPTADPTMDPTHSPTTSPTVSPSNATTVSPLEMEEALFSNLDESMQWTLISLCILAVLLIIIGSIFLIVRSGNKRKATKSEAIMETQQKTDIPMNVIVMKEEEGMMDGMDTGNGGN